MNEHLLVGRVRSIIRTWRSSFTNEQVQALALSESHNFPLHKDAATRIGVINRLLQDERDANGLIFIRSGLYKYTQPATDCGDPLAVFAQNRTHDMNNVTPITPAHKRAPMTIEWLHPSQLFIDRNTLVNPRMPEDRDSHLRKIANDFDWNKFKVLTVAPRPGDQYAILDGGGSHRIVTVIRPEFKDFLLPCHVVDRVKTRAQEAGIFGAQKYNKRLVNRDFYIGELIAGLPEATDIRATLTENGFASPSHRNNPKPVADWPNGFENIPVARALYREGGSALLSRTLLVARASWQEEPPPQAFTALGAILKAYPRVDEDRLRKVLKEHSPKEMIEGLLLERGKMHPYARAISLAHKYVDCYDHEFRGDLIGGTRERVGRRNEYVASPRSALNTALTALISTWKLAQRAPKQPSGEGDAQTMEAAE